MKKHNFKTLFLTQVNSDSFGSLYKLDMDKLQSFYEAKKAKNTYEGLDDPDTAGKWINEHIKFQIDGDSYKIAEVDGKVEPNEDELKEIVKAYNGLNLYQKCWVVELLRGFNMNWTMGNVPHNYSDIKEYFEPLNAGMFGKTGLNDEIIDEMKAA